MSKKVTGFRQQHAGGAGPKSHAGSIGKATNAWKKPRKLKGFNTRGFKKR